jgi:hypothetical protein
MSSLGISDQKRAFIEWKKKKLIDTGFWWFSFGTWIFKNLLYWTATQGYCFGCSSFGIGFSINQLLPQNYNGRGRRTSAELTNLSA